MGVIAKISDYAPGLILSCILGAGAIWIAEIFGMPVMLLAIVLGLLLHPIDEVNRFKPGTKWASRGLLYIGVALMGLRIDLSDLSQTGWLSPIVVIVVLALTILAGIFIGRVFNQSKSFSVLMSGAVAICGVSAAAAICAALEDSESRNCELAITVAGITVLSTVAMLVYPVIALTYEFDNLEAGLLMGGAIHNVSQAVGAGYAVSPEAGDISVLLKLIRVSMLLPVILLISVLSGKAAATANAGLGAKIKANFPLFLIVFFILAVLSCAGLVPETITLAGNKAAHIALVVSLVAIGIKTNLKEVVTVGVKPLIVMTLTTLIMAVFIGAFIVLLGL